MNDVAPTAGAAAPSRRTVLVPARASRAEVARRIVAWIAFYGRVWLAIRADAWRGRDTPERRIEHVRRGVHRMGAGAIPVVRQLSLRQDLLPTLAPMLAAVGDSLLPFPFEEARARIAAAARRPEAFAAIDPTPITSTAMACEYRAVLPTGEQVQVRVRRPGIRRKFAADIAAIAAITSGLERTTIIRPGLLEHIRTEIGDVIVADSDFRAQARFQTLLRRKLDKDRIRWATAPEVRSEILSDAVVVSGTVNGLPLADLLGPSDKAKRSLAALKVEPRRLGRRILQMGWWGLFENQFFEVEPSPHHIIVEPGGRLVFLGFRHVMTPTGRGRRLIREAFRRMSAGDASAATDLVVQALSPLPFIDVFAFTKHLEARLWQQYLAMIDPDAPPDEKSFGGFLAGVLAIAGEAQVPVHQDIAGMLRSAAAFDEIALRLDPTLRPLREFRGYLASAERRVARRRQRKMRRGERNVRTSLLAAIDRGATLLDRAGFYLESKVDTLPVANLSMASKVSYALSELLSLGVQCFALLIMVGAVYTGWRWREGTPIVALELLGTLIVHPALWLVMLAPVIMTLRRLQFRLLDKDPDQ